MPRAIVGRAVAAGVLAGSPVGAGIGVGLAGGNPYIVVSLLTGGAVLIATAFKAAEERRNEAVAPKEEQ